MLTSPLSLLRPLLFLTLAYFSVMCTPNRSKRTPHVKGQSAILDPFNTPFRRLTPRQYENVVKDLFQLSELDQVVLSRLQTLSIDSVGGFETATVPIDPELLDTYLTIAREVASQVRRTSRDPLLSCRAQDDGCISRFITTYGRRILRRPLEKEEQARYRSFYDSVRAPAESLIALWLSSPSFLYIHESTVGSAQPSRLDPFSVASKLSFLIWQSTPDDGLLQLAADNRLTGRAQINEVVSSMLADSKAIRMVESFFHQLFSLEKLDELDSDREQLVVSMKRETLRFASHIFQVDGKLDTLVGGDFSFIDRNLAQVYQVDPANNSFGRVTLDRRQRAGVLTHASVLATTALSFPEVHRGAFVRRVFFCDSPSSAADLVQESTTAERLAKEPCKTCHILTDRVGEGFGAYDAHGRLRERSDKSWRGEVIQGSKKLPKELLGAFSGPRELAEKIIKTGVAHSCFFSHWFRFALVREETSADRLLVNELLARFQKSGGDMKELVHGMATSNWFAVRNPGGQP